MNTSSFPRQQEKIKLYFFCKQFSYNIYENSETHDDETHDDELTDKEKEVESSRLNTTKQLKPLKDEVKHGIAGRHVTLETDTNPKRGKDFRREKNRGDKRSARAAYQRGELDNFLTNRAEINDFEADKRNIAKDIISDKIKGDLKDAHYTRDERKQIYEANANKFIEQRDDYFNNNNGQYTSSITINIPMGNLASNNVIFTESDYPRGFRKLKEMDDKITELIQEGVSKKTKFDKANEDNRITKEELQQEGFSKKESKKIIKHKEKAEYHDEKAGERKEEMNVEWRKYTSEIAGALNGSTNTERYSVDKGWFHRNLVPRWISKSAKKTEFSVEEAKQLTDMDRLSLIFCDYNMDGDITPKALKQDFRTKRGKTLEKEYKKASGSENTYTISASELRESIELSKAEVGENALLQNMITCMNTLLPENKKIASNVKSTKDLLNIVAQDFAYVDAFRRSILQFPNNVTDLLAMGHIGELYQTERKQLVAFDTLKAREIGKQLSTLNLETVDEIWREIENDKNLSTEEKKIIVQFEQDVKSKARTERDLRLQYLQDIQKNNPPSDPIEKADLEKEIARLQSPDSVKHFTLLGVMAFVMGNYQGLSEHVHHHENGTTTVEKGYYKKKSDGTIEFVKLANNTDSLKDILKRTTMDAFGIGAGGTLVNLTTVGRFVQNISRGGSMTSSLQSVPGSFDPTTVTPEQAEKNNFTKRGYTLGLNVGYNPSVGLGHRIGNTNYYPANIHAGVGATGGYNTILGWTVGAYAYAGAGWMRNAGRLKRNLDPRSSKESSITAVAGFDRKGALLGADVQFGILRKNYIKGYEIIADSIQTKGTQVIDDILAEISVQDHKNITRNNLLAIIRSHFTKKGTFSSTAESGVMLDKMANNTLSMMEQLHPGISSGQSNENDDLTNPETRRIIAQDLAFNASLNWLNENYDALRGLKFSGLSVPLSSVLGIIGGIFINPLFFATSAQFILGSFDYYRKNKIQEEHVASRYSAEHMREYNIGARTLEGKSLSSEVEHINKKINILCNSVDGKYIEHNTKNKTVFLSSELLKHPSVFPVYINPKYSDYYQSVEAGEKTEKGLLVPESIASGILTMVGKEKQGALYIGYTADDHHMFYDAEKAEDGSSSNPERAIVWNGQQFTGNPKNYESVTRFTQDSLDKILRSTKFKDIYDTFNFTFKDEKLSVTYKDKQKKQTRTNPLDVSGKQLVFTKDKNNLITLVVSGSVTSNTFDIEYNYKKEVTSEKEKVVPVGFEYKTKQNFQIDPNTQRGKIKSLKSYKFLTYEVDKGSNVDRSKAAAHANQVLSDYKFIYKKSLGIKNFSADDHEAIIQFIHQLIGSKYCEYTGNTVEVGKGASFAKLMKERTTGFHSRWLNDPTTKSINRTDMEKARNNSLTTMFNKSGINGLTLENYMDTSNPNKYSFDTEASSMIGFIYGYGGKNHTHDEKLVLAPDIVKSSYYTIDSVDLKKYSINQVQQRYDAMYGKGKFVSYIGDKIGYSGLQEKELTELLNGTNPSIDIHGGRLTITPKMFFYPECFNEGIGLDIQFTPKESTAKTEIINECETVTMDKKDTTNEGGFFVNNITVGMTSTKDALGIGLAAGMTMSPGSKTTVTSTKTPDSTTEIKTTPLNEIPGVNITDNTITTISYSGYKYVIAPINGTNGSNGYVYLDINGNVVTGAMKDIISSLGSLDPAMIDNLNKYDATMQGPTYITVPGNTQNTIINQYIERATKIGWTTLEDGMRVLQAINTGNPEATNSTRDKGQQQRRTNRRVAPL